MGSPKGWRWQVARLLEDGLYFTEERGIYEALQDGFFFLEIPQGFPLSAGDKFAKNFYLSHSVGDPSEVNQYRNYCGWTESILGKYQGYFCRDVDQTEHFFLQRSFWSEVFPVELQTQAEAMKDLAIKLLRSVLAVLDIPEMLWNQACGHCFSPEGTQTLTFNHFRPAVNARGLNVHKDSGWVTILRSLEPGLEVNRGDRWYPIEPRKGYFIVNFGCAMEILTKHTCTPVAAVPHRVVQQTQDGAADRFSYAMFLDSSLDPGICAGLYTYKPESGLELYADVDSFLETILMNTYQDDSVGLY